MINIWSFLSYFSLALCAHLLVIGVRILRLVFDRCTGTVAGGFGFEFGFRFGLAMKRGGGREGEGKAMCGRFVMWNCELGFTRLDI